MRFIPIRRFNMATINLFSVGILCAVLLAAVSWQAVQGKPDGLPEQINPFGHLWIKCNYTENPGSSCQDCNTRLICTKVGGFVIPCWLPHRSNCVDGECVAEPSPDCAGSPPSPPPTEGTTAVPTQSTTS